MPKGFIITRWTEDDGLIIESSYPNTLIVDLDDMMRIFYAHITGSGEAGNVLVRLEKARSNVYSYFTGMESKVPLMINLLLEIGEDPEMFGESVIAEINDTIVKQVFDLGPSAVQHYKAIGKLKDYMKKSLALLERLSNLTKEQTMAQIYSSEKGRAILEFLREGPKTRKDLQLLVEKKLDKSVSNLEIILDALFKINLVEQDWIDGFKDIFLFLVSDFTITRIPAEKNIERAKQKLPNPELADNYLTEAKKFFSSYKSEKIDNFKIANNVLNPDKYDFIALLREKSYPLQKLPKSSEESLHTLENLIRTMAEDKILTIIKDSGETEWVFLLSDVLLEKFYPEYLIESIREDHNAKKIQKKVALKQLELLEKIYTKV